MQSDATQDSTVAESQDASVAAYRDPRSQYNEGSIFFRLPAELRNIVYELVLVYPSRPPGGSIGVTTKEAAPPAFMHVCCAMRIEGLPVWLSKNVFEMVFVGYDLTAWLAFDQLLQIS